MQKQPQSPTGAYQPMPPPPQQQLYYGSPYPQAPPQQQQQYVAAPPPGPAAYTHSGYDPAAKPYQQGPGDVQNAPVVGSTAPLLMAPQYGTPIYGDDCPTALRTKFVSQGYKDVPFAIAFVLQLLAMIVVAGYNGANHKVDFHFGRLGKDHTVLEYLAAAFGIALVLSMLAMLLMRLFPKPFIWGANLFCIALSLGLGIYFLIASATKSVAVVWFILAAFHGLWLFVVRRRIPFAGVLLSYSVSTVTRHWGTIVVSFLSLPILVAYVLGWAAMALPTLVPLENREIGDGSSDSFNCWFVNGTEVCLTSTTPSSNTNVGALYGLTLLFLLMLYWTVQVVTNVVHVTAGGTVATWYFAGNYDMPHNPSVASFRRASTTSFGSICFGSLLVAVLKLIHSILRSQRNSRAGFIACIALCCIGILERLLQYFNVYAFTHVAIYGMSYLDAARATWSMISQCGWAAVFNDNLVEPVLMMTSLVDSLAIGFGLGFASSSFVVGALSFFVGFMTHILMLRVVYSGIVTIFVCFAECSDVLATSNPQFNRDIQLAHEELKRSVC